MKNLVVLIALPPGLLQGLPPADQGAIVAMIGKPVTLLGYSFGQAELEFVDANSITHTIWVDVSLV